MGPLPELLWVKIDDLIIDRTYQRECSPTHAQSILVNFRWAYFQAITVTRLESGRYAVLDGQHRVIAARIHPEIKVLPAICVAAPSIEEQAASFSIINRTHRYVSPVELYFAALAANDPAVVGLEACLRRCGVSVASGVASGSRLLPAGQLRTVAKVRSIYERFGDAHLSEVLTAIAEAWPNKPAQYSNWSISAVSASLRQNVPREAIIAFLKRYSPSEIESHFRLVAKKAGKPVGSIVASEIAKFNSR